MKVIRIIARLNVGGPARHVIWLTAGLPAKEFQSVLVTGVVPPGEDDMSYLAKAMGIEPLVIPQMSREISPGDLVAIWKLYRLFLKHRPHIVHTHTAKAGTVGRCAGFLYKWLTPASVFGRPRSCRFVHTYHGHIFHSYYGRWKTSIFLVIERMLARLTTDKIIVLSRQQLEEIHVRFGVGRGEQFLIVPLGLDIDVFANWHERRSVLRCELKILPKEILIGIVGRLTAIKNHELFIEAAALLTDHNQSQGGPSVRFIVIGDGELRATLEKKAASLGISDFVCFLGTRSDPEYFYPALDVVALTSKNEGTPLTLIEAMANARPVIATAVGGVEEMVGEEAPQDINWRPEGCQIRDRGILVEPNEPHSFSRGMSLLVDNKQLRQEMGGRGLRFVQQFYSRERLVKDVTNLYRQLASDSSRARAEG